MTALEETMRETRIVELDDGTRAVESRLHPDARGRRIAAILEDFAGVVQAAEDVDAADASLVVHYRAPAPVGAELVLRGWIERVDGRRMTSRITCHADGRLTADARAVFVAAEPELVDAR
jgi:acyl-CoA thioesterase FadM